MKPLHTLVAMIALAAGAASPALAQLKSGDDPEASPIWQKVRASLFGARALQTAVDDTLVLEAPTRAEDAAVVPVAVRVKAPQTAERYVDKLYLIIDNNPSPISAVFQLTPDSGRADIETRVRVDEYTHVRAIAELNDGSLLMRTRFVKASGGCSAPPGKDAQAAKASMGRMRLQVVGPLAYGQPAHVQLMISHPNDSGLVMDQLTRQYTPPHFVRKVDVTYDGRPVLSADVDFSISENPNFRFYFVPRRDGELRAEVVDTKDLRFTSTLPVRAPN